MTIEAKLEALTAAVNNLTGAIMAAHATTLGTAKPVKSVSPSIDKAAPAAPMTAPATQAPAAGSPAAIVAEVKAVKSLTYDDVKVPFLALVKKNRDLALATLKPFGLDSLKPAKPEQFAAILAALNNALAS